MFLDEPTSGLDAVAAHEVHGLVLRPYLSHHPDSTLTQLRQITVSQPEVHRNAPDQRSPVVNLDPGQGDVSPPYAVCVECGLVYVLAERYDVCPKHSGLEGILEIRYDTTGLRSNGYSVYLRDSAEFDSLLRYSHLMPVGENVCATVPSGWVTRTPLTGRKGGCGRR